MNSPNILLREVNTDLENRIYNVLLGNKQTIKVHVKQEFMVEKNSDGSEEIQESLLIFSPNVEFILPYKIDLNTYYPEKTLDQKMERAAIEYGGTIDDMYSPGC
tara:strand:+ start:710 stop:1021 length:312 start_codon:yes stop_codon:yes gene_type:complete